MHKLPLDAYKSRRNSNKGRCPRNPFHACATLAVSYYNLQVVAPLLCGKSFARRLNRYASIQTGRPVNRQIIICFYSNLFMIYESNRAVMRFFKIQYILTIVYFRIKFLGILLLLLRLTHLP